MGCMSVRTQVTFLCVQNPYRCMHMHANLFFAQSVAGRMCACHSSMYCGSYHTSSGSYHPSTDLKHQNLGADTKNWVFTVKEVRKLRSYFLLLLGFFLGAGASSSSSSSSSDFTRFLPFFDLPSSFCFLPCLSFFGFRLRLCIRLRRFDGPEAKPMGNIVTFKYGVNF